MVDVQRSVEWVHIPKTDRTFGGVTRVKHFRSRKAYTCLLCRRHIPLRTSYFRIYTDLSVKPSKTHQLCMSCYTLTKHTEITTTYRDGIPVKAECEGVPLEKTRAKLGQELFD